MHIRALIALLLTALCLPAQAAGGKPSLAQALKQVRVPPDWFNGVTVQWDTNRPWKDGRLEVRRLLGLGGDKAKEGVKLTYLYYKKGDIGDGHEYPMYLFMTGHYAWAVQEYQRFLKTAKGEATHALLNLASCYQHFGEYARARETLEKALETVPPPPWRIARQADVHDRMGDLYAEMGDAARAKQHYAEAIRLLPTSTQPFGRHLLHRQAARVQSKLDLLTLRSLASAQLRDGSYSARSLGYAGDLDVTVTVRARRIADVQVKHQEKIDLDATKVIPQRIIAKQSLNVDGITGATVTCQGIVDGALQALRKAGLK